MRRNRIIWFISWVLSLVGISFYGGTVSYGLFTVLTLVPVFSLVYLLYVYYFFHIYQKIGKRYVVVNETVPFYFSLVNDYLLLFVGIRVIFHSSFSSISELSDETEYELTPKSGIGKETKLVCRYRGEYNVGIERIEIEDYFRLFKISYKNRDAISAIVRPQLVVLETLGDINVLSSSKDSILHKSSLDVLTREYQAGDPIRNINWSQTARTGALLTRNLIGEDFQSISILVETSRRSKEPQDFIPLENKILEITLATAFFLSRKYLRSDTYYYNKGLVSCTADKENQFDEYYDNIAQISFDERYSHELLFEEINNNSRHIYDSSMVFMVVSYWDDACARQINLLAEHGIPTVVYMINEGDGQLPDLSDYKGAKLIRISPYDNLQEVLK